MGNFKLIQASGVLPSPARVNEPTREPLRVGAVQTRFHEDPAEHKAVLAEGIEAAAAAGAQLVCNQEITLSPYVCWERRSEAANPIQPEPLESGPSYEFAAQMAAKTGAAGPELMSGLAHTLIVEYKDRSLRAAEQLDSRLAVPSVGFFFMPFLFLILVPLLLPVLNAL